jgi:glycosyltransferase involved in cell wall biosynthesis
MPEPLVSIILTSYNQPVLLKRAFDSLTHQSYKNIEIIIVDDCSTDENNKKLIEEFVAAFPNKTKAVFQQENVGIPKNKNTGLRLAKGEYITYLDGDDTYYENKIAFELETFLKNADLDIAYSNFDIKNTEGQVLSVWASGSPAEGYIFKDILLHNFPDCHTHRYEMFKRHVLYDLNFYDEQFPMYEDLDLMLRYSLKYKVAYNNYIGSSYYKNPRSIVSKTNGLKRIEHEEKVYAKHAAVIQEQNLEKEFKKYSNRLQLDKLFYLEKMDYGLIFKTILKQPQKIITVARAINFLQKTKKA